MSIVRRLIAWVRALLGSKENGSEPEMIAAGWDQYAEHWSPSKFSVVSQASVKHLGDEWTSEDVSGGGTTYGLPAEIIADFSSYLEQQLLAPNIIGSALKGMEIGPGGGRLTELLLKRSSTIYAVDGSKAMLAKLRARFQSDERLHYHLSDGKTLPLVGDGTLDYVVAFDVFVHFEPRLIFWYLRQIAQLLKPGGVGIIHYSNIMTVVGAQQFLTDVAANLRKREQYFAFGVMSPQLMGRFLELAGLEAVTTDMKIIPRDAVAVFRKPSQTAAAD